MSTKEWMVSPVNGDIPLERMLNKFAQNSWEIFDVLKLTGGKSHQLDYKVIAFRDATKAASEHDPKL